MALVTPLLTSRMVAGKARAAGEHAAGLVERRGFAECQVQVVLGTKRVLR